MVEFDVVNDCDIWKVIEEFGTFIEKGTIILVALNDEVFSSAETPARGRSDESGTFTFALLLDLLIVQNNNALARVQVACVHRHGFARTKQTPDKTNGPGCASPNDPSTLSTQESRIECLAA